ncbi:NADP-dependent oxidoreductase, partial [Tsukamurella paurometabola]|nr:NADP-dependent oxidoreductase [Tsukamurella paurometabola]MBS4104880.1 NADP-dependent oxidoreductase [Tsukamurella paurometabola]
MGFAGRCIGVYDFGGTEVLTAFEDVKTLDGPDRVVLRNRYCGVNPVDVSFRIGRMRAYAGDLTPGLVLG